MAMWLTIATAAKQAGLTPGTLRVYERLGLLCPQRDSAGRRIYTAVEVNQARRIAQERKAARTAGLWAHAKAHAST